MGFEFQSKQLLGEKGGKFPTFIVGNSASDALRWT